MFVDASALIAILVGEPGCDELEKQLLAAPRRFTSAVAFWEATVNLKRIREIDLSDAQHDITEFLSAAAMTIEPMGADEAVQAVTAFARYGKKRHPANLNMGDCFAYACARTHNVPLLYVGNDFAQTDVNAGFS